MMNEFSSTLHCRNIRIHSRRTSVRLEPEMWNALNEIAEREGCSVHDLCCVVHDLKEQAASFTAALRVFMMEYYRSGLQTDNQTKVRPYAPSPEISGGGGF